MEGAHTIAIINAADALHEWLADLAREFGSDKSVAIRTPRERPSTESEVVRCAHGRGKVWRYADWTHTTVGVIEDNGSIAGVVKNPTFAQATTKIIARSSACHNI